MSSSGTIASNRERTMTERPGGNLRFPRSGELRVAG
jgi:hypothetical protein